ncbi:SLC13 family permease [Paenibacillus nicotianae]|uniref:SLC13 family permease n=1 Tax=Paenibacillus nicotianae TaxID=1526551 RepID=A0ABW4UNQ6_9BACL
MQPTALMSSWQPVAAIVIFLIIYAVWMTDRISRALIALAGALIFLVIGIVHWQDAYMMHIQWNTIFLWIGMMLIAAIMNRSGLIPYAAIYSLKWTKGGPIRVMLLLTCLTAIGSALLDSVTMVLLIVPVTFVITRKLELNPVPFLIAEILVSNLGGAATLIGHPVNIWIGSANPQLTFNLFLKVLGPIVLILLVVNIGLLLLFYRKSFRQHPLKAPLQHLEEEARSYIQNPRRALVILLIFILTLVAFVSQSWIGIESPVIALSGAVLMLLVSTRSQWRTGEIWREIEWETVLFFIGLFILVGGLVDTGWISLGATQLIELTNGNMGFAAMIILWITGLVSAAIDNIPWVATMIPLIQEAGVQMNADAPAVLNPLWWALSLGACIGGNGTLIGASSNLLVAAIAHREKHHFSYMEFLKIGLPLTLISLAIASAYLYFIIL